MYLELDRLSKQFDGKYAVHDLSLGLEEGGLLCILGSSGCGKTTTLNMIGGFLSPDSGRVLLDGQDMYGYQMIEELSRRSERAFALKTGTLYPLLHSLEEKELIRSYEKDEGAARPRRYYHLERKGQHLLPEKELEWATFTTAVDRVLKGGGCLGPA